MFEEKKSQSFWDLHEHHLKENEFYRRYCSIFFKDEGGVGRGIEALPYLPVRLFKELALKSIPDSEVYKMMTSSGTTGLKSKIFLDKRTAQLQTRGLKESFQAALGKDRKPFLVIDSENTIKDRSSFSARTAAINGFRMFSKSISFCLKKDLSLDIEALVSFHEEHRDNEVVIFGFTFLIWDKLYKELAKRNIKLDFSNAVVLHGGGWKKLAAEAVDNEAFNAELKTVLNCKRVVNYYGMIEQTGSIYFECSAGNLHASNGGDFLIRNKSDLTVAKKGDSGLIQVFSDIQFSYPGGSLLTEDVGLCVSDYGQCPCGDPSKGLRILGRLEKAEIRGCSDAV